MNCDNPEHERCERCTGCVPCGCICHLAGEDAEDAEDAEGSEVESDPELVHLEMGLREYSSGAICVKCGSDHPRVTYHSHIVMTLGTDTEWPCAAWVRSGLLTGSVTEHLCIRCLRCNYGFPCKTADA